MARGAETGFASWLQARLRLGCATLLFAVGLLAGQSSPSLAQEPVFLTGSSWGFVPPPGFAIEPDTKAMFYHPAGALIVIFTSTQPHDRSRFTAVGGTAGRGEDQGRVTSIEDVTVGGRGAYLMRMRMFVRNADAISLLVQGRTSGTLTAMIPDDARSSVSEEAILAALYTATERSLSNAEQLAGLPVEIGDIGTMRVSGMISTFGTILTDGPGDRVEASPDQTFVTIVTIAPNQAEGYVLARDPAAFGRNLEEAFDGATVSGSRHGVGRISEYIELSFRRKMGDMDRPGVAWSFVVGGTMVLMVVQLPVGGDPAGPASLVAMRDSVSAK